LLQEILDEIDRQNRNWHKNNGQYDFAYQRGVIKGLALAKRIILGALVKRVEMGFMQPMCEYNREKL